MKRLLPRSLFGRLVLILLGGLLIAQLLTAYLNLSERGPAGHRAGGDAARAARSRTSSACSTRSNRAQRRKVVAVFNAPPLTVSLDRPRSGRDAGRGGR